MDLILGTRIFRLELAVDFTYIGNDMDNSWQDVVGSTSG
jgi:hypothetical protein